MEHFGLFDDDDHRAIIQYYFGSLNLRSLCLKTEGNVWHKMMDSLLKLISAIAHRVRINTKRAVLDNTNKTYTIISHCFVNVFQAFLRVIPLQDINDSQKVNRFSISRKTSSMMGMKQGKWWWTVKTYRK